MNREERLAAAFWVCTHCASKFGASEPNKIPKFVSGWCDICESPKQVTEFERYGFEKK